jgi:hypothetical protein
LLSLASAAFVFGQSQAPEINPGSGVEGMALIAGAILLIRSKTSKR